MNKEEIQIQDLFEGAFLLCKGFNLKDLNVTGSNGKKIVTFILSGNQIQTAREEYQSGRASCNVAMLKCTMSRLKDAMFERIRSMERPRRNLCQSKTISGTISSRKY